MSTRTREGVRAMTLVEVVVAMAVLGLVLVSLLQGAPVSVRMQQATSERITAEALARELLEFVSGLPYEESGSVALGVDAGENSANRNLFHDVDDFEGWSESPPLRPDGTPMPGMDSWTREVNVEYVDPDDPSTVLGTGEGAKLVRVTVLRGAEPVASIERVRYRTMDGAKQ